jgi:hypothetical protein
VAGACVSSALISAFRPGLSLARDFYREVVQGLVDRPHAACLLGGGSDVLGYDQPRSTDHELGATAAGLRRKQGRRLGRFDHRARSSGAVRRMAGTVRYHVESPHSTPGWATTFESIRKLVTVGSIDQLTHADDAMVNFTPWPQRLRDTYRQLLGH